jgi:hypothetical protein
MARIAQRVRASATIRSSAALSLGKIEQRKECGRLKSNRQHHALSSAQQLRKRRPYVMPVPTYGYPSDPLSFPFLKLKTESKDATTMNNVSSTKCRPGQIHLPNPNADANTGSSRKLPSGLRNRSGLKESGSGYITGSCRIALQLVEAKPEKDMADVAPHIAYDYRTWKWIGQYEERDTPQANKPLGIKKPS